MFGNENLFPTGKLCILVCLTLYLHLSFGRPAHQYSGAISLANPFSVLQRTGLAELHPFVVPLQLTCRLRGGGRTRHSRRKEQDSTSTSDESSSDRVMADSTDESESEESDEESSSSFIPKRHSHRSEQKHQRKEMRLRKPSRSNHLKNGQDSSSNSDDDAQDAKYSQQESTETDSNDSDDQTMYTVSDVPDRVNGEHRLPLKESREPEEKRDFTVERREVPEAPSGKVIKLTNVFHSRDLLSGLASLRQNKSSCDVVLVASDGKTEFPAHKSVLCALSHELRSALGDQKSKLHFPDIDASGLEIALNFVYSGEISCSEDHLPAVLGVSEKLGVKSMQESCTERLLAQLKVENALHYRAMGQHLKSKVLFEAAHHVVMDEFQNIAQTPAFVELNVASLKEILSSDDLAVDNENDVFEAIVRWVEHDELNRKAELLPLLTTVRFGLMSLDTLAKKVAPSALIQKYLSQDASFQALLNSAITYVGSQGDAKKRLEGPMTRLRAGSRGRYLMCIGGRKGSSAHAMDKVWMLDRVHYDWYELEPLISPRKQLAASEVNGKLFVCGGWDGEQYLRGVEFYEPGPKSWTPAPMMQVARGSFGLASMRGELWAAGGYDGQRHLASVERLNVANGSWSLASPLLVARSGLRLAALEGPAGAALLALGGFDGHSVVGNVERFDEATQTWKACAPMTTPRRDFAVAVHRGFVYAAGGFDGKADLASVERYDPHRDEWTPVANMTTARSGFGMATINERLHALGGYDGTAYLSSAEIFREEENAWAPCVEAELPLRMAHFAAAVV